MYPLLVSAKAMIILKVFIVYLEIVHDISLALSFRRAYTIITTDAKYAVEFIWRF
jgi:hypothetical protein